jgi:uncharacterized iron-regulated protein
VLTEAQEAQRFAGPGAPRLVFLGEHHADPRSQAFEVRALHMLLAQKRPVSVALEMFPPQSNAALDAWRHGKLTEAEFVEQSHWYETWGFPFAAYRAVFQLLREGQVSTYGVNVDDATRKAVRESAPGQLPEPLRSEIGGLDLEVAPHTQFLLDSLRDAGHDSPGGAGLTADSPGFQRMQRIQVLWDTVIGERAARLAESGPPDGVVVVLLGSGHVAYGLGANLRAARISSLPQLSMWDDLADPQSLDAKGRVRVPVGTADWVRIYPQASGSLGYPALSGLKLAADPAGVRIDAVRTPSGEITQLSEDDPQRVLQAGDLVQTICSERVTSPAHLRLMLEAVPWDQPVKATVLRSGTPVSVTLVFRRPKAS